MQLLRNATLNLRALEPEDLEKLYKWENDSTLWSMGSTLSPYSRHILKEYIANSTKDIYEQRQLRLMIVLNETDEAIGTIDLYDFDPHNCRAGVGVLLDSGFQGRGYAASALELLTVYAFSFIKMHQLYAMIPETNRPSLKLFKKNGFEESGLLKEWNTGAHNYINVYFCQKINDGF